MIDDRKLTRKIHKKVWEEFQTLDDEVDFLARLKQQDPARYAKFLETAFTREEGIRIEAWLRTR